MHMSDLNTGSWEDAEVMVEGLRDISKWLCSSALQKPEKGSAVFLIIFSISKLKIQIVHRLSISASVGWG